MNTSAKLIFLCGKMAAGKSTLAPDLANRENAVLLGQSKRLYVYWCLQERDGQRNG